MGERFKVKQRMRIPIRKERKKKAKPRDSVGKCSTAKAAKGFSQKLHDVKQTVSLK